MHLLTYIILGLLLVLPLNDASAAGSDNNNHSKYVGQEQRKIKSLSQDDIKELQRGGGWGLAKAAELNGVPGPAHLLELKDKIPLTKTQISSISKIYKRMKEQAIQLGNRLISMEEQLEKNFQRNSINRGMLKSHLNSIAQVRSELRFVHLATHLETPKILSKDQIDRYNTLRGYSSADPCKNIPEGHNAEMWRKHNNCG